jgi:hypothetical protein
MGQQVGDIWFILDDDDLAHGTSCWSCDLAEGYGNGVTPG